MRRPNVLFLTSHDVGRHLNCYGVEQVHTPSLDRLAAGGFLAERSFCTAPQCSPSRASMFTGRYPHSNGVLGLCHGDFGWDLHPTERHLGELLREAGYRTATAGSTHEMRRGSIEERFDEVGENNARCESLTAWGQDKLARFASSGEPFFLELNYFEPHRTKRGFDAVPDESKGICIPPYLRDELSAREDLAEFQGAIRIMDEGVGRVLHELEGRGLSENTVVVFAADHGVPFPRAKCSLYDPGIEAALLVRIPGRSAGQRLQPLISNVDVLPTLLELLELPVPEAVQGQSFLTALHGGAGVRREAVFAELTYHDYCAPQRAVRTEQHKLIVHFSNHPGFMNPSQNWRSKTTPVVPDEPAFTYCPPVELYDLSTDPWERRNLADDPECKVLLTGLAARLHEWMVDTQDPLLTGIPEAPMARANRAFLAAAKSQA